MEQRIYYGNLSPAALAEHLVRHYDPQENLQAQNVGGAEGSYAVQIGRGDVPEELRHAVTVAITPAPEGGEGIAVTLGQQQWLTPRVATFAAMTGLIGALVTPWALFALLWPVSELAGSAALPGDVWKTIDLYIAANGGSLAQTKDLVHPHAG